MNILGRDVPESGHTLKWKPFAGQSAGGHWDGVVRTPACLVECFAMHSDTPYGWLSANYCGRQYRHYRD